MVTKYTPTPAPKAVLAPELSAAAAPEAAAPEAAAVVPANRAYIFAKTCTNDHGSFAKGDKARGAFSSDLVASYVAAGILVEADRAA